MAILVVGSVAFDSIETPHGKVDHCLGGAATHFALAASYFHRCARDWGGGRGLSAQA